MKKTIAALMLAGTVLGGMATSTSSVFASVVDNGDNTQNIIGQQNSQIEFKGQIGEINAETADPNDPDAPAPGTDWIKAKLPTKVVYYSTSKSKHAVISSGNYSIQNLSAYPVDVQVTGFVGEDGTSAPTTDKIQSLSLKSGTTVIDLVKDSKAETPKMSIFKLGANKKSIKPQDTTGLSDNSSFIFEGTTRKEADLTKLTTLQNKLDITLVGLDSTGNTSTPM